VAAGLVLGLAGCRPPIGVTRVSPRTVSRDLTQSALNSDQPSEFSRNVLHRFGLSARYRRDPEGALAWLYDLAIEERGRDTTLFALAELSFAYAERTRRRDYFLQSAVAAWTFLFPGADAEPPDAFDPRLRIAADLYNRGLTQALASADGSVVELRSGLYALPFGQYVAIHLRPDALRWAGRELVEFVPVAELRVRGLRARHRRAGIGAPLAARALAADHEQKAEDFLGRDARTPVTALLRIPDARRQLAAPLIEASLAVYTVSDRRSVEIDGRQVRLEAEPSAALAWTLSQSQKWRWERRGFFIGDLLREELPTSLTFTQPFQPDRIPVVLVHGTLSSAGRWADLLNDLENDGRIRDRFQFWFFHYSTGSPIPYSAMLLRDALTGAVAQLDPDGTNPALHEMVAIGHSQGGLLVKMTVVDAGTRIWDTIGTRPLAEIDVSDETRDLLERALFVRPLPFVRRVVFIATPHGGSALTTHWLARLVKRFVELPGDVLRATADLLEGNTDGIVMDVRRRSFGSVYQMRLGSPFLEALRATPIVPGVAAHSIIPVTGDGPAPNATDGVVTLESARLDGVESELIIPFSRHSAQGDPATVEEVRRLLLEHAAAVCAASGVGCGYERGGRAAPPGEVPEGERPPLGSPAVGGG